MSELEPDAMYGETAKVDERLSELGIALDPEINYRRTTMFPKLDGWGAKGALKNKAKVISQIEPLLKEMLHEGEEVLYIAKGTQYSFAEHYFMGIWAMTINQTVFVLTNARLLMMRTNSKGRPKQTFWVLYYSQIDKFAGGWTGVVTLKLKDGKKLQFTGFPKLDRQSMPRVFEDAVERYRELGFDPEVTQSLENLCCGCFDVVPKDEYDCEECGITYWKPKEVALRSLVIPSWGDIVLKHHVIALVEFLGGLITWFVAVLLFIDYLANGDISSLFIAALIITIAHGTDALITYFVARKGLHPKPKRRNAAVESTM